MHDTWLGLITIDERSIAYYGKRSVTSLVLFGDVFAVCVPVPDSLSLLVSSFLSNGLKRLFSVSGNTRVHECIIRSTFVPVDSNAHFHLTSLSPLIDQ